MRLFLMYSIQTYLRLSIMKGLLKTALKVYCLIIFNALGLTLLKDHWIIITPFSDHDALWGK